jgi:adenine-specific DNA-methyltransferase
MNLTDYQAKHFAHELTKRCPSDSLKKLAGQKQAKALESQRNTKRRALFDAQDEIDRRREQLIAEIEGKLQQRVSQTTLFSIRWTLA